MTKASLLAALAVTAVTIPICGANGNGRGVTPVLGWRDWNQYQSAISQSIMEASFRALADKSRTVDGVPTSLLMLGYNDAGVDDAWQKCGSYGPQNWTFHDANGYPVVDTAKFANISAMVAYGHSLGLSVGFYYNNCNCKDHCRDPVCFAGDVQAFVDWGFDSVKLDGCSAQTNVDLWNSLLDWTSKKPILIENCNNGAPHHPNSGNTPTAEWCPFHMYRSSSDIRPVWGSVLTNLMSIPPLAAKNLSTPGCFAYPDMLEVGVTNTQDSTQVPLTHTESRTHFGAWCIVSAPLILGLNITDSPTVDGVWDIITNTEAIAINQAYAGFSGTVYKTGGAPVHFSPCGWWTEDCSFPAEMYLYKPLPGGSFALQIINNGNSTSDLTASFAEIPGMSATAQYKVRDIWAHADAGTVASSFTAKAVGSRDSAFVRLEPVAEEASLQEPVAY